MASHSSSKASKTDHRPSPLRTSRSFSRPEQQNAPAKEVTRTKRASTLTTASSSGPAMSQHTPDVFETTTAEDDSPEPPRASVDLDDLPIELISLTDSFIDSLSAKVHPSPPNIDSLSVKFQDFYALAASHIQTHIDSLASRQRREQSPASSSSPRSSAASLLRAKAASIGVKDRPKDTPVRRASEQQLLTAEEVADRKKARKALEQQRGLLEEAVERRLCEGIYNRIYRHRTTQDEEQDAKLRSKTAALSVVGIGPRDLGIELGDSELSPEAAAERQEEVRKSLEQARKELVLMNQSRYPLGKLNRLKAVHKAIIDTLSHFHPSSSADELMPMLIYTLITLPPEDLNVISDLHFIQRFRWEPKLFGEAAYCLTTLEAAISFLETVDLSTLRADEAPSGPPKAAGGRPVTPRSDTFPPAYTPGLSVPTASTAETSANQAAGVKPVPSPAGLRAAVQLRNRRLSDLVNTPALALGAASDAVFNTADQSLKNIGNSLGDSYKFLLGKLIDQKDALTNPGGEVLVPKTLDDARKMLGTPPPHDDDVSVASGASSAHVPDEDRKPGKDDKVLNLIGGTRKVSRDHSADSARSAGSSKKVLFAAVEEARDKEKAAGSGTSTPSSSAAGQNNPALIDSMRNLGNQLNPMSRLSGFRGFGRTASTPAPSKEGAAKGVADGGDLAAVTASLPPKPEAPKIDKPIKRFMEIQSPGDLRLGEVLDLLRDYRRLAGALKDMGAFKE
ncbi:hypothetical protein CONLIGDRAFT_611188 [Coniochaeta ligniaria NRRL 30616]|uniref:VPS9 domain-containing protein n=1 Tax=Coniochaeta ligniaria NRRL 30616 TaxID=1408157 RepID=A0A1J7J3X3_9PEZI|nr:hypothetical protein CONLIGDRAFT_611188 [Coniochaeta ligniaria NRRL 30616]